MLRILQISQDYQNPKLKNYRDKPGATKNDREENTFNQREESNA